MLEGKEAGATAGRLGAQQAEIARLRRQLAEPEQKLATTETALEIIGKAHALLVADLRERGHRAATQEALMGDYTALTAAGVTTRAAADLTGVPRATVARRTGREHGERARVLAILNGEEFIDQPPASVHAA